MKTCTTCHQEKEISEFVKRTKDTYRNICKSCYNSKYRKNPIQPIPKEGYKYCASCKKEKALEEYNIRKRSYDGKRVPFSYCKPCERKKDSQRYNHACERCKKKYKTGKKDSRICVNCHRELMKQNKIMYKYKKRNFKGERNPMYGIQRFGTKNPNYNPNKTEEEREKSRLYEGYGIWRKSVLERDKYTCQKCGSSKGTNLCAHHKDGYSWCVKRRLDINNGVTLCESCHKEFHLIYGFRNNTEAQYNEFNSKK